MTPQHYFLIGLIVYLIVFLSYTDDFILFFKTRVFGGLRIKYRIWQINRLIRKLKEKNRFK